MHGQVDMGPEARITGSHWSAVGAGSLASDGLGMREACSQDAAQRSAARTAEGGRQRGEHQRAGSYTPHLSILISELGRNRHSTVASKLMAAESSIADDMMGLVLAPGKRFQARTLVGGC